MKKSFLILAVFFSVNAFAQDTLTGKCWTPEMDTTEFQNQPWFSNNDYLEHFLDSIGYPAAGAGNRIVGAPQVRFWIPIKFWVYRNDDGTGGPTLPQIQTLMDNLNRRFNQTNNTWIGFYMKCDPTFVNNTTHVNKTFTGASLLMAANNDHGSINIHVIGSFHSGALGFAISSLNACMIPSESYLDNENNGDLAHEVGHVLGLQHTHQYSALDLKCLTESVSRTRTWPTFNFCSTRLISNRVCEATGDALRDTQADNDLVGNSECFYNVNFGNDEWGDSYDNPPAGIQDRPNIRNIMSYNTATDCVDHISRLQIGVMLWTLYFKKTNNLNGWANPISTFDDFEPDNNAEMTININRHIQINQIQERNFHQQWNRVGGYAYTTQCDVDWVRFVAPCTNTLLVFTSAMPNRTNANTRLTLFNNALVQLAQNDNINGGNLFSRISFNFTAGQEYFIRVENMDNLITGYYNLQITPVNNPTGITGVGTLCNPSVYSIDNLPQGANVIWSVTPANIVNLSCINCTQTTASVIGNGTVTLTANVNSCVTYIKTIHVGVPAAPSISTSNFDAQCGTFFEAYCSQPPGATGYRWDVNLGQVIQDQDGNYTNYIYVSPLINTPQQGQIYYNYVTVQSKNTCGLSAPSEALQFTVGPISSNCGGGGGPILRVGLSPNPTSNNLNAVVDIQAMQQEGNNNPAWMQIKEIRIYDKFGNMKKRKQYPSGTQSISLQVNDLVSDVYNVQITNGIHTITKSVIIQH